MMAERLDELDTSAVTTPVKNWLSRQGNALAHGFTGGGRSLGRHQTRLVANTLYRRWQKYLGQQGLKPTQANLQQYIQGVYGNNLLNQLSQQMPNVISPTQAPAAAQAAAPAQPTATQATQAATQATPRTTQPTARPAPTSPAQTAPSTGPTLSNTTVTRAAAPAAAPPAQPPSSLSNVTVAPRRPTTPQPQTTTPPTAATAATQTPSTGLAGMGGGIAGAISGNLRDMLWDKLQRGDTTELGSPSRVLTSAKAAMDAGQIRTRDDFDNWLKNPSNWKKSPSPAATAPRPIAPRPAPASSGGARTKGLTQTDIAKLGPSAQEQIRQQMAGEGRRPVGRLVEAPPDLTIPSPPAGTPRYRYRQEQPPDMTQPPEFLRRQRNQPSSAQAAPATASPQRSAQPTQAAQPATAQPATASPQRPLTAASTARLPQSTPAGQAASPRLSRAQQDQVMVALARMLLSSGAAQVNYGNQSSGGQQGQQKTANTANTATMSRTKRGPINTQMLQQYMDYMRIDPTTRTNVEQILAMPNNRYLSLDSLVKQLRAKGPVDAGLIYALDQATQ